MAAGCEHRKGHSVRELEILLDSDTSSNGLFCLSVIYSEQAMSLSRNHCTVLSRKSIISSFIATKFGDPSSWSVSLAADLYKKAESCLSWTRLRQILKPEGN